MTQKKPLCAYSGQFEQIQANDYINPANVLYPPGWLYGLKLGWTSASGITVSAGNAMDSSNAVNITLSSAQAIANTICDIYMAAGTVALSTSSTQVTGTSTLFRSAFGTRAGTGTISATSSTTITGSSTLFLSQVAVNDLIGNNTTGYYQVTAVNSDTSLTVGQSVTFASAGFNVIETPTISCFASVQRVVSITSDTVLHTAAVGATTSSGLNWSPDGGRNQWVSSSGYSWNYVHLVWSSGSGASIILSTQRTTPYAVTFGSSTNYRRLGSFFCDSSGSYLAFTQFGNTPERHMRHEFAYSTNNTQIVTNTNVGSTWTLYTCSGAAPPTATALDLNLLCASGTVNARPANYGASPFLNYTGLNVQYSQVGSSLQTVKCDGAQNVQLQSSAACYAGVAGWVEEL